MRALFRFTLTQTVLFNLVFVLLIVAGAFSIMELPVERYPQINFGKVIITTFYPGAAPRDVEALVTREVEDALEGLEDVEFIRSTSFREYSQILVKFRDDVDYDARYDELRFRILSMLDELPEDVDPPSFTQIRTSDWLPVLAINLVGERSNRALSLMAEELKVPLESIEGIQEVRLEGEYQREFHVYLDPVRMSALGISFEEAAQALRTANVSIPAGDYTDDSGEYLVKVDEKFRDRSQVMQTVIRRDRDGSFVRLADVASDARIDYRDPSVVTSVNGLDSVALKIIKTESGNALRIYRDIQRIVADAGPTLAKQGVELVLTQDSTTYIEESMNTLGWNMALGILLVSLIIWYFMGFRNAALTTIGIPFAFLVTMVLMHLTGNSLNEITLFAFVLVSGIIVDDAIVVVENIYRRVQAGADLHTAIIDGTSEVAVPVIAATATTVAAFLPMLLMTGSTGEFFALIPKAVTFAIVASLVECLLILPIHFKDFGPRPGAVPDEAHDNLLLRTLRAGTDRLVNVTLRFRFSSLALVLIAFGVSVAMLGLSVTGAAPLIRIKFFPDDYNLYYAFIEGPPDTALEVTTGKTREIARFVMADGSGQARSAAGFAGFTISEDYQESFGHNLGTVMVALPRKADRSFEDPLAHLDAMRERLTEAFARDGFDINVRAEKDGPPAGKDINIRVVGSNERSVSRLAGDLLAALRGNPELSPHLLQLEDDRGQVARVFRLAVDQARAQENGLTVADAASLASSVLDGRFIGKFRVEDEEIDFKLRIDPAFLDGPEAALEVPVLEHPSGPVRLGDIVQPQALAEPGELHRYQKQRSLTLTANIRTGAPISSPAVVKWATGWYQENRARYPGATLTFGGEFEETRRSYTSLTYAFGLAVLIIYLILATQFRSYGQPLIILSAVIFSIIGVVFGKFVTQSLFTVNSFIAVVGVTGVVVNDSLVLIDFINRGYRSGLSRQEAIRAGIRVRLRPILLTTLTTTLGLLPMALGIPSYSVVWGTMASTFVTGLATATFLTLFIVPVEWDLLMGLKERFARRRHTAAAKSAAESQTAAL
jgi:HAE1 family hydrophobic/amphiphilic exporter-1